MKKIEFLYIIFLIFILVLAIFVGVKYFAKNTNPSVNEYSSTQEEIARIPFSISEILSTNRVDGTISAPTTDLKGLNEYLLSLKGSKVTSKNIMIGEIDYELNISGVVYRYSLAYKNADTYLYLDNVIWKIDVIKLDSFF